MAVEFYMTEGKYLSIGRLACSGCKIKGLKVLISLINILRYDFQNLVLTDSNTFFQNRDWTFPILTWFLSLATLLSKSR